MGGTDTTIEYATTKKYIMHEQSVLPYKKRRRDFTTFENAVKYACQMLWGIFSFFDLSVI